MKKLIFIFIFIIILSLFLSACSSKQVQTQDLEVSLLTAGVSVTIRDFSYSPAEITIEKGTTVTWTNQDSALHTVSSDQGWDLDSGSLSQLQSYSHTFNESGTFEYHCVFHSMMKAKVIVE